MTDFLRSVLVVALTAYFCYQLHRAVTAYLAGEVTTTIKNKNSGTTTMFPSFTFCPRLEKQHSMYERRNLTQNYLSDEETSGSFLASLFHRYGERYQSCNVMDVHDDLMNVGCVNF